MTAIYIVDNRKVLVSSSFKAVGIQRPKTNRLTADKLFEYRKRIINIWHVF
jgi:hypothetical protein